MSGFFKIGDFFLKSVFRKTAEFSVSDTGDPLILTCLLEQPSVLGGKEEICVLNSFSNKMLVIRTGKSQNICQNSKQGRP